MKKRTVRLMALALTMCMTVTSFTPAAAAVESEPVSVEGAVTEGALTEETETTEDEMSGLQNGEQEETEEDAEQTELPKEDVTPDAESEEAGTEENTEDTEIIEGEEEELEEEGSVKAGIVLDKEDADKRWSEDENGFRLLKTGSTEEKPEYYTREDGLVCVVEEKVEGGITDVTQEYYIFSEEGYLMTGRVELEDGETPAGQTAGAYFMMDEMNLKLTEEEPEGGFTPVNSQLGAIVESGWMLITAEMDTWRHYGKDGGYLEMPSTNYADMITEIHGDKYYLDENGKAQIGKFTVDGKLYEFKEDTVPVGKGEEYEGAVSQWVQVDDKWLYYDKNGEIDTSKVGNQKINGKRYYLAKDGTMTINRAKSVDGKRYYYGEDGTLQKYTGWVRLTKCDGRYYYFHEKNYIVSKTGWQKINGKWFYFSKDGKMYYNKWIKDGKNKDGRTNLYYLRENGMMTRGFREIDGNTYFFYTNETNGYKEGSMAYGWLLYKDEWYYFGTNGKMRNDGYTKVGKNYYYFNTDGTVFTGYKTVDGGKKVFKPSTSKEHNGYVLKSQWVQNGKKWHYADANGNLETGWATIKGKKYYFNENYTMQKEKFIEYTDGTWGYLDSDGVFTTNEWVKVNGKWRYLKNDVRGFVTGWQYIDGYKFYFDSKGNLDQDLRGVVGSTNKYRLEVNRKTCVVTVYAYDSVKNNWKIPVVAFRCSVGLPSTPTPVGTWKTVRADRWQLLMGPSWGQYGTWAGVGGIYFHSVSGASKNNYSLPPHEFNNLGNPRSHGCIRLCVSDAKWIYQNCNSCTVQIGDNLGQPFDKPVLPFIPASQNWDPTDPEVPGTSPSPH